MKVTNIRLESKVIKGKQALSITFKVRKRSCEFLTLNLIFKFKKFFFFNPVIHIDNIKDDYDDILCMAYKSVTSINYSVDM